MGSSNRLEKFRAAHALRRGSDPGSTAPVGYTDPGGSTRSFSGNDKSAYVWSPPFSDPLQPIFVSKQTREFEATHTYPRARRSGELVIYEWGSCFPAIDVSDYRIITVLIEIYSTSPRLFMEMIPLIDWDRLPNTSTNAIAYPDIGFSPIGFVNPDVTTSQIDFTTPQPVTNPNPPTPPASGVDRTASFSCRTAEPMCLRTKPAENATAARPGFTQMTLDFEVSSHRAFTMSLLPLPLDDGGVPAGEVSLYYTRRT